ncbi:MAG: hypothetical protein WCK26_01660 [Candidatus Saccharibacteria bacterium]
MEKDNDPIEQASPDSIQEDIDAVVDSTELEQTHQSDDLNPQLVMTVEATKAPDISSAFESWKDIPKEQFLTPEKREAQMKDLTDKGAL